MKPTVRTVAGMTCAALLVLGCPKPETSPPPPASPVATPSEPEKPKGPRRLKWTPGMVPTSEEAAFALGLGKMLFEQANFEEAEEQLRIASAGGKSDADGLLLRARAELDAKKKLAAAKRALEKKDYATARLELDSIPNGSVLSEVASQLAETIDEARERRDQEFEQRVRAAVTEEPEAPKAAKRPKPDGGIKAIAGGPTGQSPGEEDEPEANE